MSTEPPLADTLSPADAAPAPAPRAEQGSTKAATPPMPKEIGGPAGPEPTRYGDWEVKGRCSDF